VVLNCRSSDYSTRPLGGTTSSLIICFEVYVASFTKARLELYSIFESAATVTDNVSIAWETIHACAKQGFGSGFGSRSGSGLDPYSIGPVDPDPYSESGSGSRREKMTHKSRKNSCFEVLDGLFCELQDSSVTWTYSMEA
jgi:hypothetical protein